MPRPPAKKSAAKAAQARRPAAPRRRRPEPPPAPRGPHVGALDIYERGVAALHARQWDQAGTLFQSVINDYPDEKELHERARLYLNVVQRQVRPPEEAPRTLEERLYAATLRVNAGAYEEGLRLLETIAADQPSNDHVHYLLGVVHVHRGDFAAAIRYLETAVSLNPENRFPALQDVDLEPLREDPEFRAAVERAAGRSRDRRNPSARKSSR